MTGFIGKYFEFKCLKTLEDNLDLAWKKLTNPKEIFKLNVGSPLLARMLKDGFMKFTKDYAKANAGALIGASLSAVNTAFGGNFAGLAAAYDNLWFIMVGAMTAYNDYLLRMTQEIAKDTVNKADLKLVELQEIRKDFIVLYNLLVQLSQGTDELYDTYVRQLREALRKIYSVERDVELVWNTLERSGFFLKNRFDDARADLKVAKLLIQPDISEEYYKTIHPGKYDEEFDAPSWKTEASRVSGSGEAFKSEKGFGQAVGDSLSLLARSAGIPATEEQFANMKLVSKQCSRLIKTFKGYFEKSFYLNLQLLAFPVALDGLLDAFPDFANKFLAIQFENFIADIKELRKSMASHLNGSEGNVTSPIPGYDPVVPVLSGMSHAWSVQVTTLDYWFESIPTEALSAQNLNLAAVNEYRRIVALLNTYNDVYSEGQLILPMKAGVEELGNFEQQCLFFMASANTAMYTFSIDDGVLSIGRQILKRCDINIKRTQQIRDTMQAWVDYELPRKDVLDRLYNNLLDSANAGGFDNFASALTRGDWGKLLTMEFADANSVMALLTVLSLLAQCFKDDGKDTSELDELRDAIKEDLSLFDFSLEIDLDLNIFKGILDCIRFRGFGSKFDLQELLCSLVKEISGDEQNAVSSAWDDVGKAFGDATSAVGNVFSGGGSDAPSPAHPQA